MVDTRRPLAYRVPWPIWITVGIALLVVGVFYQHDPFTIGGPLIMGALCVIIGIKVFVASRQPVER
jgi:hypothetical protein